MSFKKASIRFLRAKYSAMVTGLVVVAIILYAIFKFFTGITVNPELEVWLASPISELKIWHLIVMLIIVALISSD